MYDREMSAWTPYDQPYLEYGSAAPHPPHHYHQEPSPHHDPRHHLQHYYPDPYHHNHHHHQTHYYYAQYHHHQVATHSQQSTVAVHRQHRQPTSHSSTRQQRNHAEKVRRDKLTHYVNELANLLPMVPPTGKKPHRTNVLRYAAAFLRSRMIANEMLTNFNLLPISEQCWDTILEGLEGILLVVTASGKIVYISKTVESLLGHQQLDLVGLSLFSFTYPEDFDVLKDNLRYDAEENTSTCGLSSRRSFSIRLRQKAASKGDQPHFEPVHIVGHLRVPQYPPSTPTTKEVALLGQSSGPNQDPVLVACVMPFKEKRVTDTSLLEANRDEWISRHLIDGKIIYSDHRISYSSGYLAEEVTGFPAFRFMHKDDVRWVMIALRQMYLHGETYGSSCYRLQIKTGKFMYLKTRGYLESGDSSSSVQSFICINTPVSESEGRKLINEMQRQMAPLLEKEPELSISTLIDKRSRANSKDTETFDDPEDLNQAIQELLANLPEDEIRAQPVSPAPDPLFEKAATVSKVLPPAIVQSSQAGVRPPTLKKTAPSVERQAQMRPSVLRFNCADKKRPPEGASAEDEREAPKRPCPTSVIENSESITYTVDESFILPDVFIGDPMDPNWKFQDFPDDYEAVFQVPVVPAVDGDKALLSSLLTSGSGQLEENFMQGHQQLEDSIEEQARQLMSIEHDLASVPPFHTNKYRNTFSDLKAEHKKQKAILKTLQQDHQAIQRPSTSGLNKRQLPLSHQDVGV